MQTLECVLWHSGLKCEVVFGQGVLSRGGLLYIAKEEPSVHTFEKETINSLCSMGLYLVRDIGVKAHVQHGWARSFE